MFYRNFTKRGLSHLPNSSLACLIHWGLPSIHSHTWIMRHERWIDNDVTKLAHISPSGLFTMGHSVMSEPLRVSLAGQREGGVRRRCTLGPCADLPQGSHPHRSFHCTPGSIEWSTFKFISLISLLLPPVHSAKRTVKPLCLEAENRGLSQTFLSFLFIPILLGS